MSRAARSSPISSCVSRSKGGLLASKAVGMGVMRAAGHPAARLVSVDMRGSGADPGLRPHILRVVGGKLALGPGTAVQLRDRPDADEGDGHREERRIVIGEDRSLVAEGL